MAYPIELKRKALDYYKKCDSVTAVAEAFGISRYTVYCWIKKEQAGDLTCKSGGKRFSKIDEQKLRDYVKAHPDAYLYEIAEVFGCSATAIYKALKRMKITFKKRRQI